MCHNEECEEAAKYGFVYDLKPIACKSHIMNQMVDCTEPAVCEHPGCSSEPTCGSLSDRILRRCIRHRNDLEDKCFINNLCRGIGCNVIPRYGISGTKVSCLRHKRDQDKLINVECENEKCSRRATHGLNDGRKRSCASHRKSGYYNLKKFVCIHPTCYETATHGLSVDGLIKTCELHSKPIYTRLSRRGYPLDAQHM